MKFFKFFFSILIVCLVTSCGLSSWIFTDDVSDDDFKISMKEAIYNQKYDYLENNFKIIDKVTLKFGDIDFENAKNEEVIEHIKEINWIVKSKFIQIDEIDDDWNNGVENIVDNKIYRGDCEDLVLTSLFIANKTGIPKDKLYKIITKSDGSNVANHMLAGYKDPKGFMWIFGDTKNLTVDHFLKMDNQHVPFSYSRYDWKNKWIIIEE